MIISYYIHIRYFDIVVSHIVIDFSLVVFIYDIFPGPSAWAICCEIVMVIPGTLYFMGIFLSSRDSISVQTVSLTVKQLSESRWLRYTKDDSFHIYVRLLIFWTKR